MKQIKIAILFSLIVLNIKAQTALDTTAAKSNLNATAQKMAQLFSDKNYAEYMKYIHPKILSMVGGKDKMIDAVKQGLKAAEDQGFAFKGVTVDPTNSVIVAGKELQSVITENIELQTKDGSLISKSYLVAISDDKGKTWYFIDTAGKTLSDMKNVFPELSSKLIIPAKGQPEFHPN